MSGHSKWHSIKHKKAATDAKRGKLFTKIIKEICVAARAGGGDPEMNPRLRTVLLKAKGSNMPQDTIKKAILRGTGDLDGVNYEEVQYEGYGPGGVAILIDVLTDNRNRTAAEMRYVMSRNNGSLGESGCVAWQFKLRGMLTFDATQVTEEQLMETLLDAGVEDIESDEESHVVQCEPGDLEAVKEAAEAASIPVQSAEVTRVAQNSVELGEDDALKAMKLIDTLEDHDDVQNVYTNFEPPESLLE